MKCFELAEKRELLAEYIMNDSSMDMLDKEDVLEQISECQTEEDLDLVVSDWNFEAAFE